MTPSTVAPESSQDSPQERLSSSKPLTPDQLAKLLPLPSAFPKLVDAPPPSSGRQVFEDGIIIRASREFRFRNGGYLWVSISDYVQAPSRLQQLEATIRSPVKDYEAQLLEFLHLPDGFGYVVWDPTTRNGRLQAIRGQRFVLQAEGGDLPTELPWNRVPEYFPIEHALRTKPSSE
ncbi:MAG: hypothetical protein RMJ47_00640 [Bacteroidota bacterium]|nr:hypothetical protein [Bacteroidota bacterium]